MRKSFAWGIAGLLALAGCENPGSIGEPCFTDGTCKSPMLECRQMIGGHICKLREHAPEPKTCHSDADCFCEQCLKRCDKAGLRRCEFTDPTVWGSKPTICECRQ